jgi:hypothetical protein
MQRVRIGLTGLAFVFVLVLLATALVRPSDEAPLTANMIEQQKAGIRPGDGNLGTTGAPQEPLAELGVAPGNAETNNMAAGQPGGARQQPR